MTLIDFFGIAFKVFREGLDYKSAFFIQFIGVKFFNPIYSACHSSLAAFEDFGSFFVVFAFVVQYYQGMILLVIDYWPI